MKYSASVALLFLVSTNLPTNAAGFVSTTTKHVTVAGLTRNKIMGNPGTFPTVATPSSDFSHGRQSTIIAKAKNMDADESAPGFFDDLTINPPYAIAYVLFLGYAYLRSTGEADGASMEVLQGFLNDPLNPGCNELFTTIFNLLGLFFIPMACLLMPGAKDQKLPATYVFNSCGFFV